MLTEAAEGAQEQKFFQQTMELWENEAIWAIIDTDKICVQTNVLIFTLLARQASLVEQLLAAMHRKPPYSAFRLLNNRETVHDLQNVRLCEMDSGTRQLLELYGGWEGDDLWHSLHLKAQVCSTNISPVESKHASVRRLLTQRSVQTWSLQASSASAEFLAQTMRRSLRSPMLPMRSSGRPAARRTWQAQPLVAFCIASEQEPLSAESVVSKQLHTHALLALKASCASCDVLKLPGPRVSSPA